MARQTQRNRRCAAVWILAAVSSNALHAGAPKFLTETMIPADKGAAIDPLSISRAGNGDFYVTGSSNFNGWAIKTDSKGNVIWRFDLYQEADRSKIQGVKVQGAAPARSGGTYMCARIPRSLGSKLPSNFWLRVDSEGHEIDRRAFSPNPGGDGEGVYLNQNAKCLAWKGSFAFVANEQFISSNRATTKINGVMTFPHDREFYWVVVFDENGKIAKEWQIPYDLMSLAFVDTAFVAGDHLVFSATDHTRTSLVEIDSSSHSVVRKVILGSAEVINPVLGARLQVLDRGESSTNIISFDWALADQGAKKTVLKHFFGEPYTLSDGRYVLFGSREHVFGESYTTGIALLDQARGKPVIVDLPKSVSPYYLDNGRIPGVTPGYAEDQFLIVRKLTQVTKPNDPKVAPVFRGIVLDFVQVK